MSSCLPTAQNPVLILNDCALAAQRTLPEACVDTIVTSPPYWGLLEERHGKLKRRVESTCHPRQSCGAGAEISLLLSALRRIGQTCPPGVAVRAYTIVSPDAKNRATLGIQPLAVPDSETLRQGEGET